MTTKRTRWLGLVLALATCVALLMPGSALALPAGAPKIGMVCTPGTVASLMHTFNLVAKTGTIQTPDGNTVFMWSYANGDAPDSGLFQYPGPVLCVTQGQTVVVNLSNTLPEPASIVFPGQDAAVTASGGSPGLLTTEAAAITGTVSYSFTAGSPGTYLYESGSNISKQVEMGLYGALIVRPSIDYMAAGVQHRFAYNTSTEFDPNREYMLLLSEVDPDLHHAVETGGAYDFTALHNRYFMVNGRAFPDTLQANGTGFLPSQPYGALVRLQPTISTTQPALIRMLNAGTLNHPFHPHGNHTREIAQDGRPILNGTNASTEHFGETIGSGQTLDYLIRWDDQVNGDNWNHVTNPLPVVQPSYLNLVFKDGNTWYSGSPYLGYKGTLPTGTLTQNICGEWYFPLHSHALNEFANFDEPFGGMATLLRVDPAGGCFAFPASSKLAAGTLNSGTVTNLSLDDPVRTDTPITRTSGSAVVLDPAVLASDVGAAVSGTGIPVNARILSVNLTLIPHRFTMSANATLGGTGSVVIGPRYYRINSATTPTPPTGQHTDWYGQFSGVPAGAADFKVTYKGNDGSTDMTGCCRQNLYIWNWTGGGSWVLISGPAATVGLTDLTVGPFAVAAAPVAGSWASYIGTGANKGLVRVRVLTDRTAGTATFVTGGNFMSLVYDAP